MMGAGMPLTLQGESDELYGVWDVGRLEHAWSSRHLTDVYYSLPSQAVQSLYSRHLHSANT